MSSAEKVIAPSPNPETRKCWVHGTELPCEVCAHWERDRKMKESIDRAIIEATGYDPISDLRGIW